MEVIYVRDNRSYENKKSALEELKKWEPRANRQAM
jgi:hypothetical protein